MYGIAAWAVSQVCVIIVGLGIGMRGVPGLIPWRNHPFLMCQFQMR